MALHNLNSVERYTPSWVGDLVHSVMGGIDLDPASCELANKAIRANHFFTVKVNGLRQNWFGNVFCNPPYGQGIRYWIEKMELEYYNQRMQQGCLFVDAISDSSWFHSLWDYPLCFFHESINEDKSSRGNVVAGFGVDTDRFTKVFGNHGQIVLPTRSGISVAVT